jgi:hypothetical protein
MAQDTPLLVLTSENGFGFSTSVISNLTTPRSANFNKTSIPNRSSAIVTFGSGDNQTLTVTFYLVALGPPAIPGVVTGASGGDEIFTAEDVENCCLGLESLVYPLNPGIYGPPVCKITIGGGIRFNNWPCVCTHVDPHINDDRLWDSNGNAITATVNCQFLGFEVTNMSSQTRGAGGIRNFTQLTF